MKVAEMWQLVPSSLSACLFLLACPSACVNAVTRKLDFVAYYPILREASNDFVKALHFILLPVRLHCFTLFIEKC
jgi:hypothetical protein